MDITIILATVLICYVILQFSKNSKPKSRSGRNTETTYIKRQPSINEKYHEWESLSEFAFDVVGESFYQENIAEIASKLTSDTSIVKACLIPDDYNPHDNKAVRIDIDGKTVGHLSRDEARSFRRRLSAKKLTGQITTCDAAIIGGYIKNGAQHHYGVALDIKPFE